MKSGLKKEQIAGVGLSRQMHGTVALDAQGAVVRPLRRRGDQEKIKRAKQKENNQNAKHRQSSPASNTSSLSLGISGRLSPWRVRLIVTNEQATMNAA